MKTICGLLVTLVLVCHSNCESLVRKKRFFNTLWPVEEVKSDVQNGLIYSNLPPEYLVLLPGVNDHKEVNRRNGEDVPARFVHPTRMAILMQPHLQQSVNTQQKLPQIGAIKMQPVNVQPNQQLGPKIVMKPFVQTTKLSPTITLKTKEQALPDIHKNQRFIPMKPLQNIATKPFSQTFNTQQQLPIKKVFDESRSRPEQAPLISIKSAPLEDFYYTKEFNDLLNKFNIKAELSKLPPISDVMAILGTENAEDTLSAIHEVTDSKEGIDLIRSYLDQSEDQKVGDEFYNYDEDVGAGEIQVDGSEGVPHIQAYPNQQYVPPAVFPVSSGNIQQSQSSVAASTTGGEKSWWKPTTWFSSGTSTRIDSLKKDAEILKNVVPNGSFMQNVNYVRKFITPLSNDKVPINPPFNVGRRRIFMQTPLNAPIGDDTQTLPTIQMTEAQFQDMVEKLRLTPVHVPSHRAQQHFQPQPLIASRAPVATTSTPESTTKSPQTTSTESSVENQKTFESPIIVKPSSTGISRGSVPLPSTFPQFEEQHQESQVPKSYQELPLSNSPQDNRRNFVPASAPERVSPYDFTATGRIHQAHPDEVNKRSRSLAQAFEGKSSDMF